VSREREACETVSQEKHLKECWRGEGRRSAP